MAERQCYNEVLPFIAMATLECVNVGVLTLYKAATLRGMNYHIFMVYSYVIATLLLLPAPFISLRSRVLPPLSFSILRKIGLSGLIGSPTLASAIGNLTPALTFILAIIFRGSKESGRSKKLHFSKFFVWATWTQIMKEYPAEFTVVFFCGLSVSTIAALVALITQGTTGTAWIVRPSIELASIICSALLGLVVKITVHTWALHKMGPLYVGMFKPLSIAIAVAMGAIFLGDVLHLGSVIGATIISFGVYTVIWGKAKEQLEDFGESSPKNLSSTERSPLLIGHKDEVV